ncbi:MAG: mechanosensitive ion channel [Clostridia bacterium]|nr:mechanosensitive ion channel [Clostridia bacterium]
MNLFEETKALLREKSGKKLIAFSLIAFLIITAIVFFTAFKLCTNIQMKLMDEYHWVISRMIESSGDELIMHTRIYEDDVLSRAEVGLMLYGEENTLADRERLEMVRSAVSAASVSLLDGQGQLLSTTGPVSPEEDFRTWVKDLKPREAHLEIYPVRSLGGEETGENDGKGFVRIPIYGNAQHSLVFEFSCDTVLEVYNSLDNWSNVLERMFSGGNAGAYVRVGDEVTGYPLNSLASDKNSRLYGELMKIFESSDSTKGTEDKSSSRIISLMGKQYVSTLLHYSHEGLEDADILLTLPLNKAIGNGFYIAAAISAIIGWGIVLIQLYVFRRLQRKQVWNDTDKGSYKWVWRSSWLGILVVIVVTVVFANMLLHLESRTNAAVITQAKREIVAREIDWCKEQEGIIRGLYEDYLQMRTQVLAAFLKEHPDYETRAGFEEFGRVSGAEYVMRFGSDGRERLSSNSYTGFAVGTNLSKDYQAVLLGYPHAVVGPEADPYTGEMQIGIAVLMTDGEGQPDGFLLGVYDADELNKALGRLSYEYTVSSFAVRTGHVIAAVNNEDGRFIAHTDHEMIGQKAEDYIEDYEPGVSFEGFTDYKGESMCISASSANGKTLLFMVPERADSDTQVIALLLSLVVTVFLALLYYPYAGVMIAQAMEEAKENLKPNDRARTPLTIFSDGYAFFLTLFAIVALIVTNNGWWTSFDYVFSGKWSSGVHLYSLWAALFILAVTVCVVFIIRTVLLHMESRLTLQARTVTRLVNSLITYAASLFLVFSILSSFGVNTTALLASAGVLSIAVGMGAQSMASDLLAGFFLMLEGTVHVGDHISAGGVTGHVTDMGIRTTEITDDEGNVVILNNSKVSPVRNMSRKHPEQENEQK